MSIEASQRQLLHTLIVFSFAYFRFLLQKLMQFEKWGRKASSTKSHKKHPDTSKQQRTLSAPPPPPPPPPSLPLAPPPPPPALIHISPPSKKSTPVIPEVKLTAPSGGKTVLQADTSSGITVRSSGVERLSSPNSDLLGLNVKATPINVTSTESSLSSSSGDSEGEGATTGGRSPKVAAAAGKRARSPREVKGQKAEAAGECMSVCVCVCVCACVCVCVCVCVCGVCVVCVCDPFVFYLLQLPRTSEAAKYVVCTPYHSLKMVRKYQKCGRHNFVSCLIPRLEVA